MSSSSSRSPLISLFIGPEGLRYGWRFLLFALAIDWSPRLIEAPLGLYLAQRFGIKLGELSAPSLMLEEWTSLVTVLLVTGVAALLERQRIDSYGLPVSQGFGLYYWKGMLAGFLVILFVGGAILVTGGMQIHGLALP